MAVLLLNGLPLLFLPTYPFVDLPNHLAEATILRYAGEASCSLTLAFQLRTPWYQPTVAHAVVSSLFPSVEAGNTTFFLLYVISVPTIVALIARRCQGDAAMAFLGVVALWNYNATWGFVGFTMAIPLVLLYLYLHLRFLERRTVAIGLCLAVVFLATYWMHVLAFLFEALCYGVIEIGQAITTRRWRALLTSALPIIPVSVTLLVWVAMGKEFCGDSTLGFLCDYYRHGYLRSLPGRCRAAIHDHFAISHSWCGNAVGLAFAAVLIVPGVRAIRHLLTGRCGMSPQRWATLAFTAAAIACCLFLPDRLPREADLWQRFSVFAILGAACVLTWSLPLACRGLFRGEAVLAAIVYSLLWFAYFIDFYGASREFCEVFPRNERVARSAMAAVIVDSTFRGRDAVLIHYNNYQIIWNRGITPTRLADYRFGMVRPRTDRLPEYSEWACRLPAEHIIELIDSRYRDCQYLLVRGDVPRFILEQRPAFALVKRSANWFVFERKGVAFRPAANTIAPCDN
ncbi:MAG: hypothetical protein LLG00_00530 [Planctomycetaceae bacterium]|nr:hypothetical protein [Planctomycetaceae bacterium]